MQFDEESFWARGQITITLNYRIAVILLLCTSLDVVVVTLKALRLERAVEENEVERDQQQNKSVYIHQSLTL